MEYASSRLAIASVMLFLAVPLRIAAQPSEPAQTPAAVSPPTTPPPDPDRAVSWKLLVPNLIRDQEKIWTFPARIAQGQSLIPTVAVVGITAGLVALDPHEAGYFRRTGTFQNFNKIFTSNATSIGMIAAPVSFYATGLIRKDAKMQRTALLAAEAVADAEILATVFKGATRRVRPSAIPPGGNFSDTWLKSSVPMLGGGGSFPSGHTIAAFSIATVVARRYGRHRWVPYVAYGAAALVGFSRLSLPEHFVSDVFVGGVLGYSISRFVVLRQ